MNPRPPVRAGHGNRRRRPPAQAAARRHARWFLGQLRRIALALGQLRPRTDLRATLAQAGQSVAERGRALAPVAGRALAGVGNGLGRGASGFGRTLAGSGRRLRTLGRLTLVHLAAASRTAGAFLLRHAHSLAENTGRLTVFVASTLWRRRAFLGELALRLAWWGALVLLWMGGHALLDIQAPLAAAALPLFLVGLGLCLPLLFARAARLRWAGFALGLGHAALAVLVWTLTSPA